MEELIDSVVSDLSIEIGITSSDEREIALLTSKVRSATREIMGLRNYPLSFTEEQIVSDLENHYFNIRKLSLYDYNQIGVEGQSAHSENGTNRTWSSRYECLNGVFAYCR